MRGLLLALSLCFALPALAVEPTNPEALCDRFLKPGDKASCAKKVKAMDLDWYAASVCNLIDDDDEMMNCWGKIDGRSYSPADLAGCSDADMSDADRVNCLMKISKRQAPDTKQRAPANSTKPVYQPLKIKK